MAGEDPAYTAWLRQQKCAAPGAPEGCIGEVHTHHPCHLRDTGHDKRRAHDHTAIPLCSVGHHVEGLHRVRGPFKGWDYDRLVAWQDEQIVVHRERWARAQHMLTVPEDWGFTW